MKQLSVRKFCEIPPVGPSPLCYGAALKLKPLGLAWVHTSLCLSFYLADPDCNTLAWSWTCLISMHWITALLAIPGYHHWTCLLLLFRCSGTCQIGGEGIALPALMSPSAPGSPPLAKQPTLELGAKHHGTWPWTCPESELVFTPGS